MLTACFELILPLYLLFCIQRQAERIKRDKAQSRRGDDVGPQAQPESLVAVSRFHGSRLASAPTPSPYEQSGRRDPSLSKSARKDNKEASQGPCKLARLSSSGASVATAIVEAENSLEIDVCFPASGEAFFRTNLWANLLLLGMSLARNRCLLSCQIIVILLCLVFECGILLLFRFKITKTN